MNETDRGASDATVDERTAMAEAIDRALVAAQQSGKAGIAASVLKDGCIVATGENEVHLQSDPTKHAEMVAITRAAAALGADLSDCVVISTLQPCEMCLSALRFAGVSRVIFAATQANVAAKYFVFPRLRIEDFQMAQNSASWGVCSRTVFCTSTGLAQSRAAPDRAIRRPSKVLRAAPFKFPFKPCP